MEFLVKSRNGGEPKIPEEEFVLNGLVTEEEDEDPSA